MYPVMIHPEFWYDDLTDLLDPWELLAYIAMWQFAERSGIFEPNFREIWKGSSKVIPQEKIESAYAVLVKERKVLEYRAEGKTLAWIKAYVKQKERGGGWQRIDNPPPPRLPLPPWVRWNPVYDESRKLVRSKSYYEVLDYDFSKDPPVPKGSVERNTLFGGGRR